MGRILILIGIPDRHALWGDLSNLYVWLAMMATVLFRIVGFVDDFSKVTRKRSPGLTGRPRSCARSRPTRVRVLYYLDPGSVQHQAQRPVL
jgi:hypothetical protein